MFTLWEIHSSEKSDVHSMHNFIPMEWLKERVTFTLWEIHSSEKSDVHSIHYLTPMEWLKERVTFTLNFLQCMSASRSDFAEYIQNGLLAGFHIGFSRHCSLQAPHCNHLLASQHPEVVWEHIRFELERGSLVGPLHPSLAAQVNTSPIKS